jgi:CysZ protein
VIYFTFTALSHLIAAPFNDLLSEEVELKVLGKKIDDRFSWQKLTHEAWRAIKEEIKKISVFGLLQILILIFNLIPFIGQFVYAALSLTITWFMLAFEYVDIPMDRNQLEFFQKIKTLRSNLFLFLGFGLASSLLIIIPVLNLVFLPICVVTGTLLYTDIKKHEQKSRN